MEVTVDSITCGDIHICSLLTENAVAGCCRLLQAVAGCCRLLQRPRMCESAPVWI